MGTQRRTPGQVDWKLVDRVVQLLFVLSFRDKHLKAFTFFSDDQVTWSQIVMRDLIRGALLALESRSKVHKKFVLAYLNDISKSPIFLKIMKEIPWQDGLGKLISQAFVEEQVAVSHVVN